MSKKFNIHDWQAKQRQQLLNEGFPMSQRPTYGQDLKLEPEDMDNPDEDLVIIGSGYLDIKNKFKERPSMTNGEYAEIGQKVVDQLHKGDKEAAIEYIMGRINETKDVSESLNPEVSQKVNAFIKAMAQRYDYSEQDAVFAIMAALKQRSMDEMNTTEHHNDEDFPGKDLSAWDLLDKLKSGDKGLYDKVEDFMKSMKKEPSKSNDPIWTSTSTADAPSDEEEKAPKAKPNWRDYRENTTGTGASVGAGAGEAFATPNAFKKKRK